MDMLDFMLILILILLFFIIKKAIKYENLKSSYNIETRINEYAIKVKASYDFNYAKLYPLLITEIKKAIEDGRRLKLAVSFTYDEHNQIVLDYDLINSEKDCTEFIENVKTIIERKIYSKNCN